MQTIVTVTMNPSVDKSSSVDRVVVERKLRCARPTFEPGGGGINVSRALHRFGAPTRAIFIAGGPTGSTLESMLHDEGIEAHPLKVSHPTRQNLTIFEEDSSLQYRFVMPGPELSKEESLHCLRTIEELHPIPDFLVLSGSLSDGVPADFYARVARSAKKRGTKVLIDSSGEPLVQAIEEGVSIIKVNSRELGDAVGVEISSDEQIESIGTRAIADGKCEMLMVTLGAAGAALVTGQGRTHIASPTVPIRSKVGAGDSTVAGFVLRLAQGEAPLEAAKFGVACGAAAVMSEGSELCSAAEAERLYFAMKHGGFSG